MSVLVLLIFASLAMAGAFLAAFIWAVRSGQYDDTCTPSLRPLFEEPGSGAGHNRDLIRTQGAQHIHESRNLPLR